MKIAYQYCNYLVERVVAAGDEVDNLDLSEIVEHYTSSGALEPILSSGQAWKYRVVEIDIPAWIIAGVAAGKVDGRWSNWSVNLTAAKLVTGEYSDGWCSGVRRLIDKKGGFADKLRTFFSERGYLTEKQVAFI